MNSSFRILFMSLALASSALPAHAGLFDDDEARRRIEQVREESKARIDHLETALRAQVELANQIAALQQELASLRGQLEVVSNDLEQAQRRQKDFYVDLDNRLRKLETAAQPPAGNETLTAPADPAAEARDYESALSLLKNGKAADAATAFRDFLHKYPQSSFLPSATFWAASASAQARDFAAAFDMYDKVVASWPDDARAPEAMLGLSNCQLELGNKQAARKTLEALIARYPGTSAAGVAKQRLGKK